ncbi:NifB/NifX family molybdenum-iron cluster-binding protein [Parvibacter caecicola]|uniref:NifB/NifX family molybdenum-iron cluster-binding protein n=1 Tax=Parvibacter caecicola TaxID=747645 RepID=UPI00249BE2AE|nr:NifB/NifX family molybdenum-iron cluster-binding protein [Parvibacter caecicola]
MKIAVACEGGGVVSSKPGHCSSFVCYTVDKGIVTDCRNLPVFDNTPQKAAGILKALGLDALIAAGIDDELSQGLSDGQIEVVLRDGGAVREELEDYLNCLMSGEEEDYLD